MRAVFCHIDVIFEANAESAGEDNHRLVRKAHAWGQRRSVASDDIGRLVDFEAETMTGAMR